MGIRPESKGYGCFGSKVMIEIILLVKITIVIIIVLREIMRVVIVVFHDSSNVPFFGQQLVAWSNLTFRYLRTGGLTLSCIFNMQRPIFSIM